MKNRKTQQLTTAAIMAALIYIVIICLPVKIPLPAEGGAYFNLGDTLIYFASYILGGVPALFASAIGCGLADLTLGSVIYILPTVIIKACMALICGRLTRSGNFKSYMLACIISGGVMACGYAAFELVVFDWAYVAAAFPANCLQWACGSAVGIALYKPALKIRRHFHFRGER